MGRGLRSLYSTASSLAALINDRLGSVRTALDESRITGDEGLASVALRELQVSLTEASGELEAMRSVAAKLQTLRTCIRSLERVGVSVRATVFGFNVESARNAGREEAFGAFVGELRALGDRISGVAEAIDTHVRETRDSQDVEWSVLLTKHEDLCRLADRLQSTAAETAGLAQGLLDGSLEALQTADDRMREITRQADEAVYYIQFGDIVRQKSEHIAAALQGAAEQLSRAETREEFAAGAATVDQMVLIQIGQLEQVRSEMASAGQKLGVCFEGLADESRRLRDALGHGLERADHARPSKDPLSAFKADLECLSELHLRGDQLRRSASLAAQGALDAAKRLSAHVGEVEAINSEIHLQALNAVVKTAALGEEGVTLSVLSMHVEQLYRESQGSVAAIVGILGEMLRQTEEASAAHQLRVDSGWDTRLHTGMDRIESAYRSLLQTSVEAGRLFEAQQAALQESSSWLGYLAEHLPALQRQIEDLESVRRMLVPWVKPGTSDSAAGELEALSNSYTMQSERDIHHRATQANPDDNLELFDGPSSGQGRRGMDPSTGSNDSSKPVEVAESSLGGNVELF